MSNSQQTSVFAMENGNVIAKDISIEDATRLYIASPESIYSDLFYRNVEHTRWQVNLGKIIVQSLSLPISSVVDFGCGAGYYLEGTLMAGVIKIRGFDYAYETVKKHFKESVAKYITFGNVMEPINCGKFDLVISIEVAEHILPEASETLVKNLTRASNKYIVFTAAIPGQRGVGHINCQDSSFWIDLFNKNGFILDSSETEKLRKHIRTVTARGIKRHKYLRRIMVFKNGAL